MFENMQGLKRTHMCGNLTSGDIGKEVVLMGFADSVRDLGGLIFINLRDITGKVQLMFDTDNKELCAKAAKAALPRWYAPVIDSAERLLRRRFGLPCGKGASGGENA